MSVSPERREIQKFQALVVACFANTEKHQVISQSCFGSYAFDYTAKSGKSFNRVLGIIVIPRHPIVL